MTWEIIGSDCGGEHRTPFDFDAAVRRRLQREAEARRQSAEGHGDMDESIHDSSESEEAK